MKELLYFTRRLHKYAGKKLYFNIFGMMIIGLMDGIGLLLIVPLLSIVDIVDLQIQIPGMEHLAFLKQIPKPQALVIMLSLYMILVVGQGLISRSLSIRDTQILTGYMNHVRLEIYRALLQARWFFFMRRRKTDLISSMTDQLGRVTNGAYLVLQFIASLVFTVIQIGIAFLISAPMTLFILAFGGVVILISRRFLKQSQHIGSKAIHLHRSYMAGIADQLNGMKDIKSNSLEASRYQWLKAWSRESAEERYMSIKQRSNSKLLYKLASSIVIAAFVFCSVVLFQNEGGYLLLIIAIFARLWPRLTGIQSNLEQIASAMPAFKAVMELHEDSLRAQELKELNAPGTMAVKPLRPEKHMECKDVYFRYDRERPEYTLEAVHLRIPANGMTAIVGKSGAGKSTLIDIMMGLLKPELGEVLIDGKPITDADLPALRSSIGYVPQDPFLFHGNVRDNLAIMDPNASEERMWEAMEFSSAAEFVRKLPQGLDTIIGDRGIRLSGGERQRLVLARVILRRPAILILDEATSSLDTVNESKIQEAIERLKGGMTVIVIAHRLTTIRNADQVIVLDQGKIVQTGDFVKLSGDKKGLFSSLLGSQVQVAT